MIRVHIICEGQTEEMFINKVLDPFFSPKEIYLTPSLFGKPGHKGGNVTFERIYSDIKLRLLGDRSAYCSTFFDFYGLHKNFPGKEEALAKKTPREKAQHIHDSLIRELDSKVDNNALCRFVPYVQMYEFEGLLFSDPQKFVTAINKDDILEKIQGIRSKFSSPEEINNSTETAPSKRILGLYSGYEKVTDGSLAAVQIGLQTIREQCQLFDNWVTRLENLKAI